MPGKDQAEKWNVCSRNGLVSNGCPGPGGGDTKQEWEESMEQIYDLVILGSGPAGLGASIYAQRAELKTLVIEKEMVSGGQVLTTYEVDNYAGLPGINGFDLGMKFREHADRLGAEFAEDSIIGIQRAREDGEGLFKGC